jgi:hypothetical protein
VLKITIRIVIEVCTFKKSTAMRKSAFHAAVLNLFLLVPASITWAQTITSQKGLTTCVFPAQSGKITVYLPDDIRPGETISGAVMAVPDGKNAKQLEKNLAEIKKMQLKLDDKIVQFERLNIVPGKPISINWLVHTDRQTSCPVELMQASGIKPMQLIYLFKTAPVKTETRPDNCLIPSHALVGAPFRITGSFDGDAANTICALGSEPLPVLAESPRQCIVMYPPNENGQRNLSVKEKEEEKCSRSVSGVDMQITTGDLNLRKGQNTFMDIKITGLQHLPDKALLTVTNLTPSVVTMTNGNLQVIPIWPLKDSAGGIFALHCPAVSLATGSFSVNINLDLPEISSQPSLTTDIPPGYTKKSCDCGINVSVTKSGNNFKARASPECKGVYGIGINTFPVCTIMSTAYEWSISSGKENTELVGKTNTSSITVKPAGNGAYTVCVKVTVTCIDGTVCVSSACSDQSGKPVAGPGTEAKPPDEKPPVTGDPTKPPTPEQPVSRCSCLVGCVIKPGIRKGNDISYTSEVKKECKGVSGSGNTVVKCEPGPVKYEWSIGAGSKDVAAIDGRTDGESARVKVKKDGAYNVYLKVTLTCSDGTECVNICNIEVPFIPTTTGKACNISPEEKPEPKMDGGFDPAYIITDKQIRRDEYIILGAEGFDADMLKWSCEPVKPDCPDTRSEKTILLNSRVRFEWSIEKGDGSFVKLGCLPELQKKDIGDVVQFKPPVLPLPVKSNDTSVTTTIKLLIIDDNASQPQDAIVERMITVLTKRSKGSSENFYKMTVSGPKMGTASKAVPPPVTGTCSAEGPQWDVHTAVTPNPPVIVLPGVDDNSKMVVGQWIVLYSDVRDNDLLTVRCVSAANCTTGPWSKKYEDGIVWQWSETGEGQILTAKDRQFIIYQAPMEIPQGKDFVDVEIKLTTKNAGGKSMESTGEGKIKIRVYRAGVKLSHPSLDWLPQDSNYLELSSELMYKDGDWKPALAHMCRIHFFELVSASKEKGVSMNAPVPDEADRCPDLQLKYEDQHEAFADKTDSKCKTAKLYQQARTSPPVRQYTIKIYSRDFGSYGLFRSFANISKGGNDSIRGEKPVYEPIPAHITHQLKHPLLRPKKNNYSDNRVTIPYDIDENRIADKGWITQGGQRVTDPAINNEDEDSEPEGDKYKGDGLSTYEEYRGFKVMDKKKVVHIRTNTEVKDIFIRNRDNLGLGVYASATELDVHEITDKQYVDDKLRWINPNFNAETHVVDQRGLKLINAGDHGSLLGIAYSIGRLEPTIPNFEEEIRIYLPRIIKAIKDRKITDSVGKIEAVVAHELSHGNNVCHHGEGDETKENDADLKHGLRSGNMNCVMRYDNVGTVLKGYKPEAPGTTLCTSNAGTGYNANNQQYGNAAANRGDCKHQIRISAKAGRPKSCGNR